MRVWLMGSLCAAVTIVAGCSYHGEDIGDALERKGRWFSYVGGDDIRASCQAGTPDRYRLVYNAVWNQQVRMYDVDGLQRRLVARATRPMAAEAFSFHDPLGQWHAAESSADLGQDGWDQLVAAFDASGGMAPPPVGLDLPAHGYSWTAAFCRQGHFGFTAWRYPSAEFSAIGFDTLLFGWDKTGVAVETAKPVPYDPIWESDRRDGRAADFMLTVGRDGLVR